MYVCLYVMLCCVAYACACVARGVQQVLWLCCTLAYGASVLARHVGLALAGRLAGWQYAWEVTGTRTYA